VQSRDVRFHGWLGSHRTERIGLSQRERYRLKVLHDVKQRYLAQVEAAQRLKVSDRQVRRLLVRMGDSGDRALVWAHADCRTLGQGGFAGEPRDVAEVDGAGRLVAPSMVAREERARVAGAAPVLGNW
jgi:hypothetical protein